MHTLHARGILLDIEGTTSSIRFVYDTMFPYVRQHLDGYLKSNWNSEAVAQCIALIASDQDYDSDAWPTGSPDDCRRQVSAAVVEMMDRDAKTTGLKQLQGRIWKDGFEQGQLVAHLFEDVAPQLSRWSQQGIDLRIYSSGSIAAQRLFFGHTIAGNLLDLFSAHYDTTTGSKRESDSYRQIASDFGCPADQIVFISDVVEELIAAADAGMQPILSLRPDNHPVPDDHGLRSIHGFDELEFLPAS